MWRGWGGGSERTKDVHGANRNSFYWHNLSLFSLVPSLLLCSMEMVGSGPIASYRHI